MSETDLSISAAYAKALRDLAEMSDERDDVAELLHLAKHRLSASDALLRRWLDSDPSTSALGDQTRAHLASSCMATQEGDKPENLRGDRLAPDAADPKGHTAGANRPAPSGVQHGGTIDLAAWAAFCPCDCEACGTLAEAAGLGPPSPGASGGGGCQHTLTKEAQRCRHGLYFGTTCHACIAECEGCRTFAPAPAPSGGRVCGYGGWCDLLPRHGGDHTDRRMRDHRARDALRSLEGL